MLFDFRKIFSVIILFCGINMAWANNKASTILSCWQEASSGKTFLVFYHNYYIIIYSNLHSEYMKPKQKIKYQKKGNVIISASYPSLPSISIKNAYTLEQKWIPAGVVTYKRISIQVLDSNLKTWKIADLDISNLPDLSPPKLIKKKSKNGKIAAIILL